jgi:hypothetical protein
MSTRADIAAWANRASQKSRRADGAPRLTEHSPREILLNWLQWNDSNGAYTDAAVRAEHPGEVEGTDYDLATMQDAWDWLEQQCNWDGCIGTEAAISLAQR